MTPLLAIAGSVLPQVLQAVLGDRTGKAAGEVAKIVVDTLGTSDAKAAKDKLASDPAATDALRDRLLAFTIAQEQINLENTKDARRMHRELASMHSPTVWVAPALSLIVTVGFFIILLLFIYFKNRIDTVPSIPNGVDLSTLTEAQIRALPLVTPSDFVIQIINICVGALAAAFATVMSFWLGSSSGSQAKDRVVADIQTAQTQTVNEVLERASTVVTTPSAPPPAPAGPAEPGGPFEPGGGDGGGVKPAAPGLFAESMPELSQPHRHFPGSVEWALTSDGISIDGGTPARTTGEPSTVRRIWKQYGDLCAAAAKERGVPVELVVATIATESGGDPNARREEPKLNDASTGLMQTLLETARRATGKSSLRGSDLFDPRTSIDAGTAYIASQRGETHFDPPRVAAAYNAGRIKPDNAPGNRWKMHCFPAGTGNHITKFVQFFGDCMVVSREQGWSRNDAPSFAAAFAAPRRAADPADPNFPPRPDFDPLIRTEERQALFGAFDFESDPRPDNPEHIRVKGDWESDNIVEVELLPGKSGTRRVRFHRLAAEQLQALWRDWEAAGLLDRIETFDGAYVPRFIRGSRRTLSNHAFGTAFDINASFNPLKAAPAAMGQRGCVRELVEIANKHGFFWGGHFRERPDGMHFEVAKVMG